MNLQRELRRLRKFYSLLLEFSPVTFHEQEVLGFLEESWRSWAQDYGLGRESLSIRRLDGGLLVRYRGLPNIDRETVLMAHTDREGFVLGRAELDGSDTVLVGIVPGRSEVEEFRAGAAVRVLLPGGYAAGQLELADPQCDVGDLSGLGAPVRVRLPNAHWGAKELRAFHRRGEHLALYAFDPELQERRGEIESSCVDDYAGVVVVTECLRAAIEAASAHEDRVNLSVLYSRSEEGKYLGAIDTVLSEHDLVVNGDGVLWMIVDASDVGSAKAVDVRDVVWRTAEPGTGFTRRARPIAREACVIRVQDANTRYDTSVALLSYQAALDIRGSGGISHDADSVVGWDYLGQAGAMTGGTCEGTVLGIAAALRRGAGVRGACSTARVGALALPMSDYRFRENRTEKVHVGSLVTARVLANKIAQLHTWYAYPREPDTKLYWCSAEQKRAFSEDERTDWVVERLLEYYDRAKQRLVRPA